jgi:hypothetical protein
MDRGLMAELTLDDIIRLSAKKKGPDWRSSMDVEGGIPTGGPRAPETMTEAGRYAPARSLLDRAGSAIYDVGSAPAKGFVAEAQETGKAFHDAQMDPSIANLTNAGVRGALGVGRIGPAAGIATAGFGTAAAKQMGLLDMAAAAEDDGLTDAQRKRLETLQRKKSLSRAEREEQNSYLKLQGDVRGAAARLKAEGEAKERERLGEAADRKRREEEAEYNRSVGIAEKVKAEELSRANRFSDSEVGKVWNKLGILAPAALATMAGGAARAGKLAVGQPKPGNAPLYAGLGTGAVSAHYPVAHDALMTPPENPDRRAYEGYARELPPTHPRKQEMLEYARGLPQKNPTRETASEELYDPLKFAERTGIGLIEGAVSGPLGGHLVDIGLRGPRVVLNEAKDGLHDIIRGVASTPGVAREAYWKAQTGANEAKGVALAARADAEQAARAAAAARGDAGVDGLAADEARRRTGGLMDDLGPAPPGAPTRQPPMPGASANPPTSPPPLNNAMGGIMPPAGVTGKSVDPAIGASGSMKLELPDEAMTILRQMGDRLNQPPVATVAGPRSLPAGGSKPGRVGWQNTWSDPAREVAQSRIESGGTLAGGKGGWSAAQIQSEIASKLPPGTSPPSLSMINERRRALLMATGEQPTKKQLMDTFKNDPGRAIWSAPIAGGVGAGLMSFPDE